ncbi:hypothetical protein [Methylobacterium sp. NMS14P]|uniref:hypothetical protein n=1 Tax=Methylobacterium sp. NMS14P TaxID=2894310 RepID=UPI0030766953
MSADEAADRRPRNRTLAREVERRRAAPAATGAAARLLIGDVGLPGGLAGRERVEAARAHRPDPKVLFITGCAENAAFGTVGLEPGMRMITEPFSVEAPAARVRAMIAGLD